MIKSIDGEIAAEDVTPGTRILTRDNGYQEVVWSAIRQLSPLDLAASPHLVPITISVGALGPDLPMQDLTISPQHRILLSNGQIRQWFQADEVLISAEHLTCYKGINRADVDTVTYVHFMFSQHEIVLANGCWSESFQPRDMSAAAMDAAHRREILELFPALAEDDNAYAAARATVPLEQVDKLSALFRTGQ